MFPLSFLMVFCLLMFGCKEKQSPQSQKTNAGAPKSGLTFEEAVRQANQKYSSTPPDTIFLCFREQVNVYGNGMGFFSQKSNEIEPEWLPTLEKLDRAGFVKFTRQGKNNTAVLTELGKQTFSRSHDSFSCAPIFVLRYSGAKAYKNPSANADHPELLLEVALRFDIVPVYPLFSNVEFKWQPDSRIRRPTYVILLCNPNSSGFPNLPNSGVRSGMTAQFEMGCAVDWDKL